MHVFITGTGSGIGKSLAQHLLNEGVQVTGISRKNDIEHPLYNFVQLDLSKENERDKFVFQHTTDDEDVVLINNAGILGSMAPFIDLNKQDIRSTLRINVEALMELSLQFLNQFKKNRRVTLLHIGSGAASRSIKGWSNYCTSKAAVHQFNEVLNDEINHYNFDNIRSIVVSPEVVDTPMQEKIRSTDPKNFPDVQNFKNLKEDNELVSVKEVSKKITHILHSTESLPNIISLRDYSIQ